MYCDNTAALAMLNHPVNSERTRHVATKYKYGIHSHITYEKVVTEQNPADMGTKWLPSIKFIRLKTRVLGVTSHRSESRKRTKISDEFV